MAARRSDGPETDRRLAIVGADGFIGSALVRAALGEGLEVTAISVKVPWRLRKLSSPRLRHLPLDNGRWWLPERDSSMACVLGEADSIALLAYSPPPPDKAARLDHERAVNVRGARAIAEIADGVGASVVFTSSAEVYGRWHREPVSEYTRPEPGSPYAIAKLEAEEEIQRACEVATCLRIATVFGPGENGPRAIPSFIRAFLRGERPVVHGDGSDIRDYVYVDDVAAGIMATVLAGSRSRVRNLGSGAARTTTSVFQAVASVMGRPAKARYVANERQRSRLVLDTSAIAREFSFQPRVQFEDGLRSEVEWLTRHLAG